MNKVNDNQFAEYLKQLRETKNWTVNQLALRSGVSPAQISRIENGKRGVPRPETIKKLSEGLGESYEEMMKVAGYFDEEEINNQINSLLFSQRLKEGMNQTNISIEDAAEYCRVRVSKIQELLSSPKDVSESMLYDLASLIHVTPDYLGGFTDDPTGFSSNTPKPLEITEFLRKHEVMFQGIPLNGEDKQKIEDVLTGLFWNIKEQKQKR